MVDRKENYKFDLGVKELITGIITDQIGLLLPLSTLYTLTSVCIFSILLSRHFLGFWQGEFVQQSRASLVGDHLLYSHDLNVCEEKLYVSHSVKG